MMALVLFNVRVMYASTKWLTEDQLAPAFKVRKGALLDAVRAQAPRGKKGKAAKDIMAELREAGAVSTKTKHVLKERAVEQDD